MFKPVITKEWLLATMELEGDGFANAGGIRAETLDGDEVNGHSSHHLQRKVLKPKTVKEKNAQPDSKKKRCAKNQRTL